MYEEEALPFLQEQQYCEAQDREAVRQLLMEDAVAEALLEPYLDAA